MSVLTAHFSWAEAARSATADAKGITNAIPLTARANVIRMAAVMEEVRALLGGHALTINSWYRSPVLNAAVGGSPKSMHMQGLAVDFEPTTMGNKAAFDLIAASTIEYDQLIRERTKSGADWIHLGLRVGPSRHEVLAAAGDTLGGPMTFSRIALG